MTPATFQDWLRGFLDAVGDAGMTPEQVKRVRDELAKVALPAQVTGIDWSRLLPAPSPTPSPAPQPTIYPGPYIPLPTVPTTGDSIWPWFGGGTWCAGTIVERGPHWEMPKGNS